MKTIFWNFSVLLLLFTAACSKESVLPDDKIPDPIQQYTEKHFPDHAILQVMKDRDGLHVSYEVILEGSFKLEFNRKHEIKDIEGLTRLPDSVVPAKILAYINEKYPEQFVRSWELDDNRQEVELDNGLDLVFNLEGDFLRIDS